MLYEKDLRRYEKWLRTANNESSGIDYVYKGSIINNKINQYINKIGYHKHLNLIYQSFGISTFYEFTDDSIEIMYNSLVDKFGFCSILEAIRINNAKHHKVKRLKDRIESIISYEGNAFFVTLTFTNDVLNRTQPHIRRKYVQRFLKENCLDYVANIDFGARNHREHYHAVILSDKVDHRFWRYGAINFKKINNSINSRDKLSLYVAKLTNHAIKETCKRCYLIYPKYNKQL